MNVVIVPSDGFVSVNGRGFGGLDLSWIVSEVHAVTWRGESGEIQIVDPATLMSLRNDKITDLAPFQQALDQWEAARAAADTPPTPTLAERRAAAWEQVKAERKRRTDGGVLVNTHWFQTDPDSRIQFLRLDQKASAVLAAGGQPTDMLTVAGQDIYWKTYDNGLVPMTAALAQGIALAVEVLDAMAFARGEQLRAQVEVADNPEDVDIRTGWPVIYNDTL